MPHCVAGGHDSAQLVNWQILRVVRPLGAACDFADPPLGSKPLDLDSGPCRSFQRQPVQILEHRSAGLLRFRERRKRRTGNPDRAVPSIERPPRRHIPGTSMKAGTSRGLIRDHKGKAVAGRAPNFHVLNGTVKLKGHQDGSAHSLSTTEPQSCWQGRLRRRPWPLGGQGRKGPGPPLQMCRVQSAHLYVCIWMPLVTRDLFYLTTDEPP